MTFFSGLFIFSCGGEGLIPFRTDAIKFAQPPFLCDRSVQTVSRRRPGGSGRSIAEGIDAAAPKGCRNSFDWQCAVQYAKQHILSLKVGPSPYRRSLMPTLEEQASEQKDATLIACGWAIQDYKSSTLGANRGIALREVPLTSGDNNSVTTRFIELFLRTAKENGSLRTSDRAKEHQPKTI
jgi:hypothetical protein